MKSLTFYKLLGALSLHTTYFILHTTAHAVCPVCTVAVGAGLGLARYVGVDDSVSGIWIGGLVLSTSFWLSSWLIKRGLKVKPSILSLLSVIVMAAFTFVPLVISGVIGHPFNTLWGLDKLLVGTILGSLAFLLGMLLDKQVRKSVGHQLFIYQKVVFPVTALALGSLSMYLLTR